MRWDEMRCVKHLACLLAAEGMVRAGSAAPGLEYYDVEVFRPGLDRG
jgi:hypothetical protein